MLAIVNPERLSSLSLKNGLEFKSGALKRHVMFAALAETGVPFAKTLNDNKAKNKTQRKVNPLIFEEVKFRILEVRFG